MRAISPDKGVIDSLGELGVDCEMVANQLKNMLTAVTTNNKGDIIDDNNARIEAIKMYLKLKGQSDINPQKMKAITVLMQTLGLYKGNQVNLNFNFTELLYGGKF